MNGSRFGVIALAIILFAMGIFALLRPLDEDIIPLNLRGIWVDAGAECSDIDAQLRITRDWINYDKLSFRADVATNKDHMFLVGGYSYATGDPIKKNINLYLKEGDSELYIISGDIGKRGPFIRC